MPSLSDDLNELFNTTDLYKVLSVDKSVTENELKRSYYKQSLKVHPDRVEEEEKETATRKFQTITKVYSILSDKEKRAVYDETGLIDEEDDIFKGERDWESYWRILFSKVTVKDIEEFEEKYKGSEQEIDDIKEAYEECEGDMGSILDRVLCATFEDEDRIREVINGLIKKGELKAYKNFTAETKAKQKKRRKLAEEEAKEADEHAKELGLNGENDLKALILKKQEQRGKEMDSFLDGLAEKYSKPKKKATKSKGGSSKKGK